MFKFKFKRHKKTVEDEEFVEKEVKKIPKFFSSMFAVYAIIFVCIMIWLFSFKSTYYVSHIYGSSMSPTYNSGIADHDSSTSNDFVYVNKRKQAVRGDIVTINTGDKINTNGQEEDKIIIKRVIATEGDLVSIYIAEDGYFHVFIKYAGTDEVVKLEEDYIKSYASWTQKESVVVSNTFYELSFYNKFLITYSTEIDGIKFYQIPENYYFCLGDNRKVSLDSRTYGVFYKDKIEGVAEILVKDGSNLTGARLFFRKWSSIWSFYWTEIEKMFKR